MMMGQGLGGAFSIIQDGRRARWFIARLVEQARELPVETWPLTRFDEFLDRNGWFDSNRPPTPRAVAEHWKRMEAADLRFPVLFSKDHGLLDGMHRLMKAHALGLDGVKVRCFESIPAPHEIEEA